MTVVVLGDVGGQTRVYRDALLSLGIDPDECLIPEGITLIQVGDVVRFNHNPHLDSLGCVEISDRLIQNNPDNYIQLLGNHDLALLGGARDPHWKILDLPDSREYVERWWQDGTVSLGVTLRSITGDGNDILITHAGLGRNYWKQISGGDAVQTAVALNSLVGQNVADFEVPGHLVTGADNVNADTAWALVGPEFHSTWQGHQMPFNQIHGHACLMEWDSGNYWPDVIPEVIASTEINWSHRYTLTTRPDGTWIRSVDWILKNDPIDFEWPILHLDDYEVVSS
jgi:hypothetical protein